MATIKDQNVLREQMGMPLLPETDVKEENKVTDATTEKPADIVSEEVKTEVKAPEVKKEVIAEKKAPEVKAELTQEEVIEFLKKKGMNISSLDEIAPKKETPEQARERRDNAKLAFAFSKGLISQKQFQSYSADNADIQSLVYRQYLQEQKKEDSSLTDSEILDEFEEKYGIKADPTSRKFKRGQAEIEVLGNKILKDSYKEVYSLEDIYSKHEADENARIEEETKLLQETPKYKAHIDKLFAETLTKFPVKLGEDTYDLEVPAEIISEIKGSLLKTETAISNIKAGMDQETLAATARMLVLDASFPHLVETAVKQALLKKQAGVKGIVPSTSIHLEAKELTEVQKELRQRMGLPITQIAN